ncbi:MAG: GspE/PulE family protein [bacterium]|nr:GspE/PulE family protein [bacterium]
MLQIPKEELKSILVKDGLLSPEKFDSFLKKAGNETASLARLIITDGIMSEEYYNTLSAKYYGVPLVELDPATIDKKVMQLIDERFAQQRYIIPFRKQKDGSIDLAMEDPSDLATIQFLERKFNARINPYLAPKKSFGPVLALYGKQQVESFKKIIEKNIQASLKLGAKDEEEAAEEIPIIAITDNLVSYAFALGASDIHIEALEKEILVRFRIDGVLKEIIRMQKEIHPAIVARFKILGRAKLDEHQKPQDGRIRYKIGDENVDLRLSILPTLYGEKVELRILGSAGHILNFEDLGMYSETVEVLERNVTKSFGIVLITGPTGSGKSTTLYAILNMVNRPEVNIVTVEDPIEYNMQYINQTQLNPTAGVTFATALRSILRQDPNIIMVGEIRDNETAEISVHAALTGHLVLSSLHTNDAPTAIPRLSDMDIPPFLISAVINAIMAQRLVRRLCATCMYSYKISEESRKEIKDQVKALGVEDEINIPEIFFRAKGCEACNNSGYKGRMGIFEILEANEEIREYIVDKTFTLNELRKLARKSGMKSMFEDGLKKAREGKTSLEELMRVIRE